MMKITFKANFFNPLLVLLALLSVLALPFAFKQDKQNSEIAQRTLVILTPHNEAIRYEFSRAFQAYIQEKYGEIVSIDWRTPGGASEILRMLDSGYLAAFKNHWQNTLKRKWDYSIAQNFDSPLTQATPDNQPGPAQEARSVFLNSNVGLGIDLLFGGGTYLFKKQSERGHLVNCGLLETYPHWFGEEGIPEEMSGETYWDRNGLWLGTCLSSFGICYNKDSLEPLGVDHPPTSWDDLGNFAYFRQLALANPSQSASAATAFEMIIQQQMRRCLGELAGTTGTSVTEEQEQAAVAEGWLRGLQLIQRISANARYFSDSSSKIVLEISSGNAAAGMVIDFYGRSQAEAVRRSDGSSRLHYTTPTGGSSISVDPIGILRGAPNHELAQEFIEYVLSLEGQKLWNYQPGAPGGPVRYPLRRLPIRRELYEEIHAPHRCDPEEKPYQKAESFYYRADWTSSLFQTIAFLVRVMCIENHEELQSAWKELNQAHFPERATEIFYDLTRVSYEKSLQDIQPLLKSRDKLAEIRLASRLSSNFRANYRLVIKLARQGK